MAPACQILKFWIPICYRFRETGNMHVQCHPSHPKERNGGLINYRLKLSIESYIPTLVNFKQKTRMCYVHSYMIWIICPKSYLETVMPLKLFSLLQMHLYMCPDRILGNISLLILLSVVSYDFLLSTFFLLHQLSSILTGFFFVAELTHILNFVKKKLDL